MSLHRPRVLLIGDTLILGGTEGQFAEVACGLDRARWDIDVACIRAEGPLRTRLEAAGIRPWSLGPSSFKSPALGLAIVRLASHLRRRKVGLVHCFDFYSNVIGIPAARLARTPVAIASQRDMGDLRRPAQRALHSAILRLATHVLVNSQAIADRLGRLPSARRGRLAVVRNGVDLTRFTPRPGFSGRPGMTVGTVANLRPEKGLVQLLEAAAIVVRSAPGSHFVIWGDGALRTSLEVLTDTLGLSGIVEMRGATLEPEKALRECDIFALPSLSEASSNVVIEAMATGLPVVATRVGGLPGLVEDRQTGLLVPPSSPEALAQAIVTLIENPGLSIEMGARGRAKALGEFSMERMLENMDAVYCRALGPGHGAPAPRPRIQHA